MTPQQYNAYIRKVQREIDNHNRKVKAVYNKAVNEYNREVKRVNDHNKKVYNERKTAIQKYNREVDKFNAEQRRNKLSYKNAIRKFNSTPQRTIIYNSTSQISKSSEDLSIYYTTLRDDLSLRNLSQGNELVSTWPERETANSLDLTNSLNGHYIDNASIDFLQKSEIENSLESLSLELSSRWKGAIFSLNHHNPDASRHFCSSSREILTTVIDIKAPDKEVFEIYPNCPLHGSSPNRRTKLKYILYKNSILINSMIDFINKDIEDVLNLFYELNKGTHGKTGKFSPNQLIQLKKRVEDSIQYMLQL